MIFDYIKNCFIIVYRRYIDKTYDLCWFIWARLWESRRVFYMEEGYNAYSVRLLVVADACGTKKRIL